MSIPKITKKDRPATDTREPPRYGVYQGVVMNNRDEDRMGRLEVWVPEFGSQKNQRDTWIPVSYCSPFAGASNPSVLNPNQPGQTSYGFWAVPPDLNSIVLIMFINGDPSRGIWIGGLYQQFMNYMVPGNPAVQPSGQGVAAHEYNKRVTQANIRQPTRLALSSLSQGLNKQGLIDDPVRGAGTSSARREAPSQVYGWSTPGPLENTGVRKGGNQFVMDDAEGQEKIRLRTRSGAQLLIDETNGLVYVINRDGTAWFQMDANGNVDIYAAQSVSVRAQQDINFRADRDINVEAGRSINCRAVNGGINARSQTFDLRTDGNITIDSAQTLGIRSQNINATANEFGVGGDIKVTGESFAANFTTLRIDLNSLHNHTHSGVSNGTSITAPFRSSVISRLRGGLPSTVQSTVQGPSAFDPPTTSKTDIVLLDSNNRDSDQVLTIVGRFITLEPCPEHKV